MTTPNPTGRDHHSDHQNEHRSQHHEHHTEGPPLNNLVRITDSRAVYTVEEVAHLLSLSRTNAYALVRAGEIPARKIGARWVISKARFHRWIDELPEATPEDIDADEKRYAADPKNARH